MSASFCWECGKPLIGVPTTERVIVKDRLGNEHPIHTTCIDTDDEDLRPPVTAQPTEWPANIYEND